MVSNRNRILWLGVALLFLALAGVAAYTVWPLLNPEIARSAPLDPNCDLRAGPCVGELPGGGRISLSIQPQSIPVVTPLQYEVRVEGMEASSVEIDFQGVDMNMGYNRPKLQAVEGGLFKGDGMIPVCVRDAMEWEAKVMVRTGQGLVAAPFRFITVKPGMAIPGADKDSAMH